MVGPRAGAFACLVVLPLGRWGWKLSAAGCREVTPGHPYECELES